jgi:RNA polymerase sigma-70 factor (ECF subfamily)
MEDSALAALMQAAQAGNAEAYRTVLRACVPLAAASARRAGVRPDAVDDVVQDVLLTIHRALPTYDPSRPFLPWLRAIATRRAIDFLRQRGRQGAREVHDPDAYLNHATAAAESADIVSLRQSDSRRLHAAIATLPPQQRHAIEMLGLKERSLSEVSEETGRTKGALKVNLHRALKALRIKLGPHKDV